MLSVVTLMMMALSHGARGQDAPGRAVLAKMHDTYAGKWYTSLTFRQLTTTWDTARVEKNEQWFESLARVDGRVVLRIDRGDPGLGNGVLYTADSLWVLRKGSLAATRPSGNAFLPLIEGVYIQPVERTVAELKGTGVDLSRTRGGSWNGRPVTVVGAGAASDTTSPQFWIDNERQVLVRMILAPVVNGSTMDIHLEGYEKTGGGWLATTINMYTNGRVQQREAYSDWHVDRVLAPSLFTPAEWTTAPHWARTP